MVIIDLLERRLLRNYVPPRLADVIPAEYAQPLLANRLSTKTLIYNEGVHPGGSPVTNLWQLTDPEWAGRAIRVAPGSAATISTC